MFDSSQFAGYQLQGGGQLVSPIAVTSTVVVPHVTCSGPTRAVDPDVGIYRQPSSVFISAGLFLGCSRGTAHVWPALTLEGTYKTRTFRQVTVHAGDVVVLTAVLGPKRAKVSVVDETEHISRHLSGAGSRGWSGPFIGTSGWLSAGKVLRVPAFGRLTFSRSLLESSPFGSPFGSGSAPLGFQRVDTHDDVLVGVAPFTHGGTRFRTEAVTPQHFRLGFFGNTPPVRTGSNEGPGAIVTHPHVAFVLVGNWWCGLVGTTPPSQCHFANGYPYQCPGYSSCEVEATDLVASVGDLAAKDYNDGARGGYDHGLSRYYEITNCGIFGIGCKKTFVGRGMATRLYEGKALDYGPITPSQAYVPESGCANICPLQGTLNSLTGGFGIHSQSSVDHTVFVLLWAPNELTCGNPSGNGQTGAGRQGVYGQFVFANIYLEDSQDSCEGDLYNSAVPGTPITPVQFATFATSHELDEAITDPGNTTRGWFVPPNLQVADPCARRNAYGKTAYTGYPYRNFTRDAQGTVVSAYVDPVTHECDPGVGSGFVTPSG